MIPGSGKSEYKRPESVLVVVHTLTGEALMLRRTHPRNFWQSVTGSLKKGESPRQAAERELYEETGLRNQGRLTDLHRQQRFRILPAWRARYAEDVRFNREHWFLYSLQDRAPVHINRREHCEMRWLPLNRAAGQATSWTNRQAIRELRRLIPFCARG